MDTFDDIVLDDYSFDTEAATTAPLQSTLPTDSQTLAPEGPKKVEKVKFGESLLLETKGIPLLRNESQYIKFQGKGHETSDLKRLMTYYAVWANNLYPKFRLKDFARRVQKPASGKRIKVMVEEWQREYKDKIQARREVLQELSGETFGDVDGTSRRGQSEGEEEESSDNDNRPLFFPISEQAAEAMAKNKKSKKKASSSNTTNSRKKHCSSAMINSTNEEDSDDNDNSTPATPTKEPRTITFSDSDDDGPVRKKSNTAACNGREHALAILTAKRKQRLQAKQPQQNAPQEKEEKTDRQEDDDDDEIQLYRKEERKQLSSDSKGELDFDEELRKILDSKPTTNHTSAVQLATSDDENTVENIPKEADGTHEDIIMEDFDDIDLDAIEMEDVDDILLEKDNNLAKKYIEKEETAAVEKEDDEMHDI